MELFNCQTTEPDEEWARIMDEVDSLSEELAIDKVE